jgi:hypothetical protein
MTAFCPRTRIGLFSVDLVVGPLFWFLYGTLAFLTSKRDPRMEQCGFFINSAAHDSH